MTSPYPCDHLVVDRRVNWTDDGSGGTAQDGWIWVCETCGRAFRLSPIEAEARATAGAVEPPARSALEALEQALGLDEPLGEHVLHGLRQEGFAIVPVGAAGAVEGADPHEQMVAIDEVIGWWAGPYPSDEPRLSEVAVGRIRSILGTRADETICGGCPLGRHYHGGRATTPEAPASPPPLDVERLARILRAIHGDNVPLPRGVPTSPREYAEQIVAMDARLASAAPSEPGDGASDVAEAQALADSWGDDLNTGEMIPGEPGEPESARA